MCSDCKISLGGKFPFLLEPHIVKKHEFLNTQVKTPLPPGTGVTSQSLHLPVGLSLGEAFPHHLIWSSIWLLISSRLCFPLPGEHHLPGLMTHCLPVNPLSHTTKWKLPQANIILFCLLVSPEPRKAFNCIRITWED